jgi:hypothetical protein
VIPLLSIHLAPLALARMVVPFCSGIKQKKKHPERFLISSLLFMTQEVIDQ